MLKTALYCYFCVWCMYSVLWALLQAGVCLICVCVCARARA